MSAPPPATGSPLSTAPATPADPRVFPPDPLPPILPGGSISLLAGASGTGKTAFVAWLVRHFLAGSPIFGRPVGTVSEFAFLAADRSWYQSSHRWFELEAVGHIKQYSLQDDLNFTPERLRNKNNRIAIFEECLSKLDLPHNALVIVDPLSLFLGGNLLDYDACLVACSEMRRIAWKRQLTLIGTAHAAKQKADKNERYLRPQDRILGSTALFGYTDTQMYLAAPDEGGTADGVYTFCWNPHHAPPAAFSLTRDSQGRFVATDETMQGKSTTDLSPLSANATRVLSECFPEPSTVRTRAELGQLTAPWLAPRHLHDVLTELHAHGKVASDPVVSGRYLRSSAH